MAKTKDMKPGKAVKREKDFSKISADAREYFRSPEFKNSPREMEKIYNIPSPESLLRRMTI
ncbi:MAG TPA: hypothetical protein VK469_12610 [Candidatus Kapabacteria bacterium]|nr:hypothetical protein [Candidatus Kapabacteria bacterium]